jgi:hypothetical protein
MKALCLILPILAVWAVADAGAPGEKAGPNTVTAYGKPRAPVRIEWLAEGEDGVVAADVYPLADYERLEVILVLPGEQARRDVRGPGRAGNDLRYEWAAGVSGAVPRVLVLMSVDGRLTKRASAAPKASAEAAALHRSGGPGRIDREAGLRVLPAVREMPR